MTGAGLLYLALFALAAAMPRHAPALLGPWRGIPATRHLAVIGWTLCALSLAAALLLAPRWGYGLMDWIGLVPVCGGIVLLAFTYRPALARAALAAALALVVAGLIAGS